MQSNKATIIFKNLVKGFFLWLCDIFAPFSIGVVFGCLAIIFIFDYLNIMHWVKYIPHWIIAITACFGLLTWKKKISYERKMRIVDDFHETVNNFVLKTRAINEILYLIKISIESYEESFKIDPFKQKTLVSGLQEFIAKRGKHFSAQLQNLLSDLPITHIYTLSTKIYSLPMKNRGSALDCYSQLNWYYNTVQKIANLLATEQLCWENSELKEMILQLTKINIENLKASLNEANELMLKFAKHNYR